MGEPYTLSNSCTLDELMEKASEAFVCDQTRLLEYPDLQDMLDGDFERELMARLAMDLANFDAFDKKAAQDFYKKFRALAPHRETTVVRLSQHVLQRLLGMETTSFIMPLLPSGLLLAEPEANRPKGCHFDLATFIYAASLLLMSAILYRDYDEALQVRKMVYASLELLGHDSLIPIGYGMQPDQFESDEMRFLHAHLIKAMFSIFDDATMLAILQPMEAILHQKGLHISLFSLAIDVFLRGVSYPKWKGPEIVVPRPELGFRNLSDSKKTLMVNCFGCGASMGVMDFGGPVIRAYGPQVGRLGDLSHFGVFRIDGDPKLEIDQNVVEMENETQFSGWTRLASSVSKIPRPGGNYMRLGMSKLASQVDLKIQCVKQEKTSIFFNFFIDADQLITDDGQILARNALEKHTGPNQKISLFKGEEKLDIIPSFEGSMYLVPLEGHKFFWGASYLVAFEMSEESKTYRLSLM